MGTRSIIAKPEGDGWVGIYHHWDGYPLGLGVTLVTALEEFFDGDLDAMTKKLIDDEPVGWSTINGADLRMEPEWSDFTPDGAHGPTSYSARGEKPMKPEGDYFRSTDTDFGGAEWLYILTPAGVMVAEGSEVALGLGGGNFQRPKLVRWGDFEGMSALEHTADEEEVNT